MVDFAVFHPGTPATLQRLQFSRLALRHSHSLQTPLGVGEVEQHDTKIRNTWELTMAFRMMARRGWQDVLVAFLELGPPTVVGGEAVRVSEGGGGGAPTVIRGGEPAVFVRGGVVVGRPQGEGRKKRMREVKAEESESEGEVEVKSAKKVKFED